MMLLYRFLRHEASSLLAYRSCILSFPPHQRKLTSAFRSVFFSFILKDLIAVLFGNVCCTVLRAFYFLSYKPVFMCHIFEKGLTLANRHTCSPDKGTHMSQICICVCPDMCMLTCRYRLMFGENAQLQTHICENSQNWKKSNPLTVTYSIFIKHMPHTLSNWQTDGSQQTQMCTFCLSSSFSSFFSLLLNLAVAHRGNQIRTLWWNF